MKRVLGLDLGSSSIGWAVITTDDDGNPQDILGMGSRIVPLSVDEKDGFEKGNGESVNSQRTLKRTQRKGYDRYQLRRKNLRKVLEHLGMLPPNELINVSPLQVYGLRAKAVNEQISLQELGRVWLLLNQKRGYKSSRKEESSDNKKETDYVTTVKSRHAEIKQLGVTIGQYFYQKLSGDTHYRVKEKVFPRNAYLEDFDAIWNTQKKYYPNILTDANLKIIRDETIFYQRALRSQKGLVSICEFEGKEYPNKHKDGKKVFSGPKVAPRTSPLAQLSKIWETVNNITIGVRRSSAPSQSVSSLVPDGKGNATIAYEYKKLIIEALQNPKQLNKDNKLSQKELFKILGIADSDGYYANEQIKNGIQGDTTLVKIRQILEKNPKVNDLTRFDLRVEEYDLADKQTGEIATHLCTSANFEQEPLYHLWHAIYSISDSAQLINTLQTDFGISNNEAVQLAKLDFTKAGFSNKSSKAMRKILPYLQQGYMYSEAMQMADYNHSNSITKDERDARVIENGKQIELLKKNSLRQPVVEKILNQMIHVVNDITRIYGNLDEIRVELARELKQSKDERNKTTINNSKRERENADYAVKIEEHHVRSTRRNIQKMRIYNETDGFCLYCGNRIKLSDFLNGDQADIEHILPKALYFDDSLQNKIPSHRACNAAKSNLTAYDYMLTKSANEQHQYEEQINKLYKDGKISKTKRNYLLMPAGEIPQNFINRQLRETQYIARKSREILEQICNKVWATSGTVTERLRHLWGWDDVLMNTHFEKYKETGLTYIHTYESNGQTHKEERVKDWSKRNDHRHHAIDALAIACTKQKYIQQINTLSSNETRQAIQEAIKEVRINERLTAFEKYIVSEKPFDTAKVQAEADKILISQKAGKKVASKGVRKVKKGGKRVPVQHNIIVPRGALSEESVYGKVMVQEHNVPVKKLFEMPERIFKERIRTLVYARLNEYNGDVKKAIASLKKSPIYLDKEKNTELEYATIFRDEYVIRKQVVLLNEKQVDDIIDNKVREKVKERLAQFGGKVKDAFKDLENNPIWLNEEKRIPIKSVRCFTGLSAVVPLKKDENGNAVSYVKPGNNHHIAIYEDAVGNRYEHVVTFWDAVERKKHKLPVVIEDPKSIWDIILNRPDDYPTELQKALPQDGWKLVTSLQQNEMFVFGLTLEELKFAIETNNHTLISKHLYRVQKIAPTNYFFRHHLETRVDDKKTIGEMTAKNMEKLIIISSLKNMTGIKVKIDRLGKITM